MYQMMSQVMSQMRDSIGVDKEALSSHWGFSRRGMHIGAVDDRRDQNIDRRGRARATERADENSGERGEEFLCIPLRGKRHGTLFRAVGHSMSFALI